MMKRILFTLCLGTCAMAMSAQSTTISGELVDSLTHETEPFATIRIFKSKISEKPAYMLVADENGKFSQVVQGSGQYVITFNSVGRKEIVRRLKLSSDNNSVLNLGTLLVQDDPKQLAGVTVTAQKPLVKMETDKMTYDVQNDVDAKANTVLDMLRKVPMVTVDGQDNISVNGSGSFKVYVDGKPNVMFSANPSQIFKSMPASSVKSIEVVTNPGAKYDAEGVGGVLNIIMNKVGGQTQKMNGYNGNVSFTGTNYGWRGNAFFSGQQGKLTYSINGMYNYMTSKNVETIMDRVSKDGSSMHYYQKGKTNIPFAMGNLSLNYEIDSVSNIGASVGMTKYNMKSTGHPTTTFSGGIYGSGFSYGNEMMMNMGNTSINTSVDYQRFLNKERTSNITLSYLFTTSPGINENARTYDPLSPDVHLSLNDLYSKADTRGTEHTFQADYTTPVGKGHTFNAGLKFIGRRNTSDSRYYDIINGLQTFNTENSVNYKNKQSILASYVEYTLTAGKFGAKVGTRYEYTWENVDFVLGRGADFKKNYGNLVPSASITYNIAPAVNIGVTYGMRISRPGITFLNPYIDRSNPTILSYGNPDLAVEKSHNVGLVFNAFTPKFMMNLTLAENFADNQIEQYSFLDNNGVLNTTYGNIVRSRWTNFSTFMNYAITPKTRIMLNAAVDYGDIRSEQIGQRNHGWQANAFLGLQQTLPWNIKFSIFTGGMTKKYTLQGHGNSFNMITSTVAKSFFKDKLDVSVMFFSPLTGKMRHNQYSSGLDFTQSTQILVPVKQIGVTVTWNFGNTKKQFQQHQSKITNDFQERKDNNQMGVGTGVGM